MPVKSSLLPSLRINIAHLLTSTFAKPPGSQMVLFLARAPISVNGRPRSPAPRGSLAPATRNQP